MFKLTDLTVAQVEAIETLAEVGFDQWASPKTSKAALYGAMLVELAGMKPEAVGALTMPELVEKVQATIELPTLPARSAPLNRAARRAAGR